MFLLLFDHPVTGYYHVIDNIKLYYHYYTRRSFTLIFARARHAKHN